MCSYCFLAQHYHDRARTGWFSVRIMCLSGISSHGGAALKCHNECALSKDFYPSWCYQDVKLQQPTNRIYLYTHMHPNIYIYIYIYICIRVCIHIYTQLDKYILWQKENKMRFGAFANLSKTWSCWSRVFSPEYIGSGKISYINIFQLLFEIHQIICINSFYIVSLCSHCVIDSHHRFLLSHNLLFYVFIQCFGSAEQA